MAKISSKQMRPKNLLIPGTLFLLMQRAENKLSDYKIETIFTAGMKIEDLKTKDGSDSYIAATNLEARDWLTAEKDDNRADNTAAWRDLNFSINMGAFGKLPPGEYYIFKKINDPNETSTNKRCIQFAKHDVWNTLLGANLIGSTKVAP